MCDIPETQEDTSHAKLRLDMNVVVPNRFLARGREEIAANFVLFIAVRLQPNEPNKLTALRRCKAHAAIREALCEYLRRTRELFDQRVVRFDSIDRDDVGLTLKVRHGPHRLRDQVILDKAAASVSCAA